MIKKLYNLLDESDRLPKRKENKILEAYRESFFDKLHSLKNEATAQRFRDCLETIDEILDPAISFPNLLVRLNQYGESILDLVSFKASCDLLTKAYRIDYKLWSSDKQSEAMENTAKLQMEKSAATGATVSRSEKNIDLALARLFREEYIFYEFTIGYLETISKLLDQIIDLINQNNYNCLQLSKILSKEE